MDTVPGVSSFTITRATIERASLEMKVIILRNTSFYSPDYACKLSQDTHRAARYPPRVPYKKVVSC
jgi:hypothetical protein